MGDKGRHEHDIPAAVDPRVASETQRVGTTKLDYPFGALHRLHGDRQVRRLQAELGQFGAGQVGPLRCRVMQMKDNSMCYRASKLDCEGCPLKPQCCPNASARKIPRSIHEGARDLARDIATTDAYVTSRRERKKVEMLFAHLKRILKVDRFRLRGPNGARDEFHLAATAQNLRKLAKLIPVPAATVAA